MQCPDPSYMVLVGRILNYIDEKSVRITFEAFKMNEYYCSSDNSHTEECIILTAL